ncbi:helix-turn-helix domain-containing protein [Patulibacter defluvii]|uniref:helix-turn-helix domain-containing protein n=1 Tax=Patulibacter defluvii TaxID=3095358 RepID=UPI002A74ED6F|nr:PucR family transcriptional regulator ligand-binding domain-containing protein [Patulibacter sp. DM4]
MPLPSVGDLVSEPELPLRQIAGTAARSRPVRSVHVTDLTQPGRYLLPGELVLTNGLWAGKVDVRAWVDEVARAGAAAVGFGLGTPHQQLPDGLHAACDAHGLPLLEVPESLSFARIQSVVAERLARDEQAILRRHLDRTRELLLRLAEGGGHDGLVSLLQRETGHAAALVGPGGRLLAHAGLRPTREQALAAVRAARSGELPAAVDRGLTAFGAPGDAYPASTLLVDVPLERVSDETRVVAGQVVTHAALEEARARAGREARGALARELLGLVRSGDLSDAGLAVRLRGLELDPGRALAVVASTNAPMAVAYAAEAAGMPYAITQRDGVVLVLLAPGRADDPVGALAATIEEGGEVAVLGGGRAGRGAERLRRSLREALAALALARVRPVGERVVRHLDVGSHLLLLDLVEPDVLQAFRDTVLGPVERWDAEHDSELVATLRAFLENGGRWRATAALLHVHHNTLRHRLARVEQLTGRELDATADRVDLHLALAVEPSR